MRQFIQKIQHHVYLIGLIMSLFLVLLCEACGRGSLLLGLRFAVEHPFAFSFDVFIIFLTWSFAIFFKRRIFYYLIVITLWGAIGITNGVILGYRNTPFTFVDVQLAKTGLDVMNNYMSQVKIITTFLIIALIAAVLILLFFKVPPYEGKRSFKKNLLSMAIIILCFTGCYQIGIKTGRLVERFADLNLSYKTYGVPYCFAVTLVDNGISKPLSYSQKTMKGIEKQIDTVEETDAKKKPNVIILQLESFFDVNHMKNLTFSENPLPYFNYLKENYTSGYFKVPTYGAGTINTEFEVLSQMNRDFFGAGEYPYKSLVQNKNKTFETVNYILKKQGYSTHAIHNNRATFYDRDFIYSHLGFDTFTSYEFMNDREPTPNGWVKDKILTKEIVKALDSTKKKDFIFTVSVQGHGEYPTDVTEFIEDPKITISGMEDEERANKLTYYVNEINEMDQFLKELTDTLSEYPEDVILAIYGDHLPSLGFSDEELENGSTFETEYVLWSNFDMEKKDEDIQAYQLVSRIFDRMGLQSGVMSRYHQYYERQKSKKGYINNMKLLEYDMLYGNSYILGQTNPFQVTDLQMGTLPLTISDVIKNDDGTITITGDEYTDFTDIYINGKRIDTEFIDEHTVKCEYDIQYGDEVQVVQGSKKHLRLQDGDIYYY
ncbi:MAG TPA: sulfatase-like hydrolase/transferase [Candidatus Scybalomonas excrementigallinarum]|nr:sulfatase-like hydrolase/transferase [Candidatus Scybalomonas excrementigallinarum]